MLWVLPLRVKIPKPLLVMLPLFTIFPAKENVELKVKVPDETVRLPLITGAELELILKVPEPAIVKLLKVAKVLPLAPPVNELFVEVVAVKVAPEPAVKVHPLFIAKFPPTVILLPLPKTVCEPFIKNWPFVLIGTPKLKVVLTDDALAETVN